MRNAQEIEKELAVLREDLQASIEELAEQVSPAANVERVKTEAKQRVQQLQEQFLDLVSAAKEGDIDARKKLALLAGITLAAGFVVLRRLFR